MKKTPILLTLALALASSQAESPPDRPPPTPPAEFVQKAAQAWVDSLPGGIYTATIRAADGKSPLPVQNVNDRQFAFTEGPVYIGMGFAAAPTPDTTLQELRDSLKYVALDRIPPPGVEASNWEIRLMTPVSSFKEGVDIESFEDGVITFRVRTRVFAVHGSRTDLILPMDAPAPADSYFRVTKNIQVDLRIEARMFPSKKKP